MRVFWNCVCFDCELVGKWRYNLHCYIIQFCFDWERLNEVTHYLNHYFVLILRGFARFCGFNFRLDSFCFDWELFKEVTPSLNNLFSLILRFFAVWIFSLVHFVLIESSLMKWRKRKSLFCFDCARFCVLNFWLNSFRFDWERLMEVTHNLY